ncbi:MAG: FAD-binding oxidoreductase [Spirochaetaceae bacterium]
MILNALLFINIFSVVICLIIIFLDRVISNYGILKVNINDEETFEVNGGKPLSKELIHNKILIPSACGGKGTCGFCKLRVVEGGGTVLPLERTILDRKEISNGFRLSCQVKVREDLKIYIPDEYFNIKEYNAIVTTSDMVTSDIKKINLKLLEPTDITFKPGQYVQVHFGVGKNSEIRAYSISSSPDVHDSVELNIKKIPEGLGSGFLHKLKVNDKITISGPYGDFYLKESKAKIICVSGGVGLAPLKSIAAYWENNCPDRIIDFYYGARTIADLYDHELFLDYERKYENFNYYPALSDADDNWTGATGFIHNIIKQHLDTDGEKEGYLCGPPIMIDASIKVLIEKGVHIEKIWYDKF